MARAQEPSIVTMPEREPPYPSLLDFLANRFPRIDRHVWEQRILERKVLDSKKQPVTLQTPYVPKERLYYFREVTHERVIPFQESIIFQNDDFLVACKPPFLPSIATGRFIEQSLIYRLRQTTGIQTIAPMNRIDRETAGLVLFTLNPKKRALYQNLFMHRQVDKTYYAISQQRPDDGHTEWKVENRLVAKPFEFRTQEAAGAINARSTIKWLETQNGRSLYQLKPITGKMHQLRYHMAQLGCPIENDNYYPTLQPESPDDYDRPLQLLSKHIAFIDPITHEPMAFTSERTLPGFSNVKTLA